MIPKLAPVSLLSLASSQSVNLAVILPALVHVALLSVVAHKEWRFVVYCVPLLNICAAQGMEVLEAAYTKAPVQGWKMALNRLLILGVRLALAGSFLVSLLMLYASAWNYPGGAALAALPSHLGAGQTCRVHIGVLPAMTGASRFGQSPMCVYDKTEGLTLAQLVSGNYTHLIADYGTELRTFKDWRTVQEFESFIGVTKRFPPSFRFAPTVVLLERKKQ